MRADDDDEDDDDDDDEDDYDDYDDDEMVTQTIQSPFQLFTFCYFFALLISDSMLAY